MSLIGESQDGEYYAGARTKVPERLLSLSALQKDNLILYIPVLLAAGIGGYFSLPTEPSLVVAVFFTLLQLSVLCVIWPYRGRNARCYSAFLFLAALFLVSLGFSAASYRTAAVSSPMLAKKLSPADVTGTIREVEVLEAGQGIRLILEELEIEKLTPEQTPKAVRIKVRQNDVPAYVVGDRVSLLAGLNPPSAPVAPGAFDFQQYAFYKQIGAFGFSYRVPEKIGESGNGTWHHMEKLRENYASRIYGAVDDRPAAIATALMTGKRAGITEADWEALRASGLAHMLAISGLHVGLVTTVIFFMVRLLLTLSPSVALNYPTKKMAAFVAMFAAIAYTFMVGATVPTIRAMLMTVAVLCAIMLDRVPFSLRMVAIAATIILMLFPEALLGASFQMSFAAVTALIYFYELTHKFWSGLYRKAGMVRKIALYFAGVCATTVIATLATLPFILFHFQQVSVYSVLANLIAMPVMAFIVMPMAVMNYMLLPVGIELGLEPMAFGINAILDTAVYVSGLEHSTLNPAATSPIALVFFTVAALAAIILKGQLKLLSVVPLVICLCLYFAFKQPDLLVSDSGKLVALRTQDGVMSISTKSRERFTADIWVRRNGQTIEDTEKIGKDHAYRCDEMACRMVFKGKNISILNHKAAAEIECDWAHIVISEGYINDWQCNAGKIIDRAVLQEEGSYALYFGQGDDTVARRRGQRPWVISNTR